MAGDKQTILVVEDDQDSRDALCAMLEALGYEPLAFGSAAEALNGIQGQNLALALLDIMMPEMNGYELLKKIKEFPEFSDMPIIMVTAKDKDSEILEGYQTGADYYITKPFTKKQLEYGIQIFLNPEE
ncbi:MAG: response regulator [Candidatus Dadabacteria bacterium]|nr:MAG: response regulator [Candidatus Dadabacteria bacterium]